MNQCSSIRLPSPPLFALAAGIHGDLRALADRTLKACRCHRAHQIFQAEKTCEMAGSLTAHPALMTGVLSAAPSTRTRTRGTWRGASALNSAFGGLNCLAHQASSATFSNLQATSLPALLPSTLFAIRFDMMNRMKL